MGIEHKLHFLFWTWLFQNRPVTAVDNSALRELLPVGLQIVWLPALHPLLCGLLSKKVNEVSFVVTTLERRNFYLFIFKICRATYGLAF